MGVAYNLSVVTDGLVDALDTFYFTNGTTSLPSRVSRNSLTVTDFTEGNSGISLSRTLLSNVDATGAGSSSVVFPRNTALETGSITFIVWFNLKNGVLNVGTNNNWRALLAVGNNGTSGDPFSMVLEQNYTINFTTLHSDGVQRRHLNNVFTPMLFPTTGWNMVTFKYEMSTGIAHAYLNKQLIRTGPMTSSTGNTAVTTAGLGLRYNSYASTGFRVYGGTNSTANPNGNGFIPGELGNVYIYNKAISESDIFYMYDVIKGRYGL